MIPFIKMCASGNDFVVINNMEMGIIIDPSRARRWCDRKRGIGADGVLVLETSSQALFKMRIINADGSEAEMCGNGARCIAKYAYLNLIAGKAMRFETLAGMINAEIIEDQIKIQLTQPTNIQLNMKIDDYPPVHHINTGVPHAVLLVDDVDAIDVVNLGRAIRYSSAFQPAGANVNFVEVIDETHVKVRTYERGVEDETLACGTGSSASACICVLLSRASSPVRVTTKGGEVLTIYLEQEVAPLAEEGNITNLFLEGEASLIFEGRIIQ